MRAIALLACLLVWLSPTPARAVDFDALFKALSKGHSPVGSGMIDTILEGARSRPDEVSRALGTALTAVPAENLSSWSEPLIRNFLVYIEDQRASKEQAKERAQAFLSLFDHLEPKAQGNGILYLITLTENLVRTEREAFSDLVLGAASRAALGRLLARNPDFLRRQLAQYRDIPVVEGPVNDTAIKAANVQRARNERLFDLLHALPVDSTTVDLRHEMEPQLAQIYRDYSGRRYVVSALIRLGLADPQASESVVKTFADARAPTWDVNDALEALEANPHALPAGETIEHLREVARNRRKDKRGGSELRDRVTALWECVRDWWMLNRKPLSH